MTLTDEANQLAVEAFCRDVLTAFDGATGSELRPTVSERALVGAVRRARSTPGTGAYVQPLRVQLLPRRYAPQYVGYRYREQETPVQPIALWVIESDARSYELAVLNFTLALAVLGAHPDELVHSLVTVRPYVIPRWGDVSAWYVGAGVIPGSRGQPLEE